MTTRLLITDLTRMSGNHICLAGYSLDGTRPIACIRPQIAWEPLTEPWLYSFEGVLRPFSIACFELVKPRPHPPHIEDWDVQRRYTIEHPFDFEFGVKTLEHSCAGSIQQLYGNHVVHDQGWYVRAGSTCCSLGTIRISALINVVHEYRPERSKWQYRLVFEDGSGDSYSLSVTDLAFRYYIDHIRNNEQMKPADIAKLIRDQLSQSKQVLLRLGLSRPFGDKPDRCFLQVTGVHTTPDYLNGRCHADYPQETDQKPIIVPF